MSIAKAHCLNVHLSSYSPLSSNITFSNLVYGLGGVAFPQGLNWPTWLGMSGNCTNPEDCIYPVSPLDSHNWMCNTAAVNDTSLVSFYLFARDTSCWNAPFVRSRIHQFHHWEWSVPVTWPYRIRLGELFCWTAFCTSGFALGHTPLTHSRGHGKCKENNLSVE